MKGKGCKGILFLAAVAAILCITLSGCLIVGNILDNLDAVFQFVQAFDKETLPENTVYGSANSLAVGFRDGKQIAFWDVDEKKSYVLSVTGNDGITTVYDAKDPDHPEYANYYGEDCFYLENAGMDYSDSFDVSLKAYAPNGTYEKFDFSYDGIEKSVYETYTENVPDGFTTIDSYIATRYELFEYFSYLVIFRPESKSVKENKTTYEQVAQSCYIAYDYKSLYGSASDESAFESEIMSAVASFEDSAAYNYSYGLDDNICTFAIKFTYDTDPYLISSTKDLYVNAQRINERAHYDDTVIHERTFPIDSRTQSVKVTSSDQLYFAVKKGYKPDPIKGSNAEYVYNELRRILSLLNANDYSDAVKVHNIYDYMVNTVIYDYDFVDNILERDVKDQSVFFSYNCLYIEGVLGLRNGAFQPSERVAICDGLSKAFLCFAEIEGIDTIKVSGTVSGGAHAWNKTKINGKWYMVDVTWGNELDRYDTGREYLSHDYLLTSDDASHEEDKWFTYPKAAGKYNFILY